MDRRANQSGYQLVLDLRRLILAFALLTLVCGAFFILGFVEGKRQVVQVPELPPPARAESEAPGGAAAGDPGAGGSPGTAGQSVRQQLDWYDSVSDRRKPAVEQPAAAERPAQ